VSYVEANGTGDWVFIARDHEGSLVGSRAGKFIEHCAKVMQPEANTTTLQALSFASEVGMSRMVMETDAINIRRQHQHHRLMIFHQSRCDYQGY
jgi:hypothetical protein